MINDIISVTRFSEMVTIDIRSPLTRFKRASRKRPDFNAKKRAAFLFGDFKIIKGGVSPPKPAEPSVDTSVVYLLQCSVEKGRAIKSGTRNFECFPFTAPYRRGDLVIFGDHNEVYKITHVMTGHSNGIRSGYCILGFCRAN